MVLLQKPSSEFEMVDYGGAGMRINNFSTAHE